MYIQKTMAVQRAKGDFLWVHLALLVHLAIWGLFLVPKGAAAVCLPGLNLREAKSKQGPQRHLGGHHAVPVQTSSASERAVVITQSFAEFLQPCTDDILTATTLWGFHIVQLALAGSDHPHPAANHVITRAVKIKTLTC